MQKITLLESNALSATLRIRHKMRVPESLNADGKSRSRKMVFIPITTDVTIRSGSHTVSIKTTVDNTARDHRLRVLFPTGIDTGVVSVDGHFDVVERSTLAPPAKIRNGQTYPPYPTEHQKAFVDVSDGDHGLAIMNVGLPEYESLVTKKGITIGLTLFRSVGYLSRDDALTRPEMVGPHIKTPDAQCQGQMTFEYGLCAHKGDWLKGEILRESRELNLPLLGTRADLHGGTLVEEGDWNIPIPKEGQLRDMMSIVELNPTCLVLSGAKESR